MALPPALPAFAAGLPDWALVAAVLFAFTVVGVLAPIITRLVFIGVRVLRGKPAIPPGYYEPEDPEDPGE